MLHAQVNSWPSKPLLKAHMQQDAVTVAKVYVIKATNKKQAANEQTICQKMK